MEHHLMAKRLKAASVLPLFAFVLLSFPSVKILKGPIDGEVFFSTFFLISALGIVKAFCDDHHDEHIVYLYLSEIGKGACAGLTSGFGLLSLITLFNWQNDSEIAHLEPLFIFFGLAGTAAEGARRFTLKQLKKVAEGD